jgi:hypothetical protein
MRLLQCNESGFSLTDYLIKDIPPYAILSHTWGADTEEVTFKDLIEGTGKGKSWLRQDPILCAAGCRRWPTILLGGHLLHRQIE